MRLIATFAICVLVSVGAAAQEPAIPPPSAEAAAASEPVVTWGGEVDFLTRYVWRGLPYSEGRVVWPTAWVSAHGFTATAFVNYDPNWDPTWNEYDLGLTYERSVAKWTLAGTYTRYVYYEGDEKDATSELIGRIAYAAGPGEIFTTHAFDVEGYRGAYYMEAGYAIEREIDSKSSISADASIAFWSRFIDRYTREGSGYSEHIDDGTVGPLTLNVSYLRRLGTYVSVRPHLSLIRIGDAAGRRVLDPPGAVFGVAMVIGK